MARIYLVRHGKAAASFTDDADPGLDVEGHEQAKQACELLTRHTPLVLLSSPLKRAQETAIPLAEKLSQSVEIESLNRHSARYGDFFPLRCDQCRCWFC